MIKPVMYGGFRYDLLREALAEATSISGDVVKVSGETVRLESGTGPVLAKVSGETVRAEVSGDTVISKISGETVIAKVSGEKLFVITESGDYVVVSGEVISKVSGETVIAKVSGETVIAKVSGETVSLPATQPVKISGETVVAKVSGETVIAKTSGETLIAKISGESVVATSGQVRALISGDVVVAKVSGETVIAKVSGETVSIYVPTEVKTGGLRQVTDASGGVVLHSGSIVSVTVKALSTNSGDIFVGGATNRPYSGFGFLLAPGEAISLDVNDFSAVYVVGTVSGDWVSFIGVS